MSDAIYEEFLELVAIDRDERKKMLPEWKQACQVMGLTEEDVRFAVKEWIPKYFQIDYLGVRKFLGAMVREGIDHTKLSDYKKNGVKIVYGVLPAQITTYYALKLAGGDKVFASFPDFNLMVMAQWLFNKGGKYFELAESGGLTYGARHCALNKIRLGGYLSQMVPPPTVDWSWGLVCDEATKIGEFIGNRYDSDWVTVTTRVPHDVQKGESNYDNPERIKYFAKELRRSMEEVEALMGVKVSDENMADAFEEFGRLTKVGGAIANKSLGSDPQPLGSSTISAVYGHPRTFPLNTGYDYVNDAQDTLLAEVEKAIKDGRGIMPKGTPKAGFYFFPWAIPWVDTLFQENGVVPSVSMTMLAAPRQLEESKFTDPYEKSAEAFFKTNFTIGCHEETQDWIDKCETFKPDAFIAGFLDYDRWIGALHKKMMREVEEATGIPSFYIEGDFYDGRDYSMEALRTRVESVCQIIRAKSGK